MGQEKEILDNLLLRYPVLKKQKGNIWSAYQLMAECYANKGKLLAAGNGGSAADAEHIAGELMKGFLKQRKLDKDMVSRFEKIDPDEGRDIGEKLQRALPAIAVTGHTALSTAYANDADPLLCFAQQVYGYGSEGDVFLAVSTSGNSKNIWNACVTAKAKRMKVVGLTGRTGGRLREISDVVIAVPEDEAYKVQELHLPVYHCLCLMLEECFYD